MQWVHKSEPELWHGQSKLCFISNRDIRELGLDVELAHHRPGRVGFTQKELLILGFCHFKGGYIPRTNSWRMGNDGSLLAILPLARFCHQRLPNIVRGRLHSQSEQKGLKKVKNDCYKEKLVFGVLIYMKDDVCPGDW
jgi:hypothetical protein